MLVYQSQLCYSLPPTSSNNHTKNNSMPNYIPLFCQAFAATWLLHINEYACYKYVMLYLGISNVYFGVLLLETGT